MELPTTENVVNKVYLFDSCINVLHSEQVVDSAKQQVLFKTWMIDELRALNIAVLPLTTPSNEITQIAFNASLLQNAEIAPDIPIFLVGFGIDKKTTVITLFTHAFSAEQQPLPDEIADYFFLFDRKGHDLRGLSGTPVFNSDTDVIIGISVGQHINYPLGYAVLSKYICLA